LYFLLVHYKQNEFSIFFLTRSILYLLVYNIQYNQDFLGQGVSNVIKYLGGRWEHYACLFKESGGLGIKILKLFLSKKEEACLIKNKNKKA